MFTGFNFANNRIRAIYEALSGDDLPKQAFWTDFTKSADRRNNYSHSGKQATEQEAVDSLKACSAFVQHISRFMPQP